MARNLYRLVECMPNGGSESWGYFDSDKEAIHAFTAIFKEHEREKKKHVHDRLGKVIRMKWIAWAWIIQRLGYLKPGVAIGEFDLPWKTIHTIQCRG